MTELIHANARKLPIEDESVQCIVTSPPYWGLRKYSGEQESVWERGPAGAYGLESTLEMYIAHTVEILRELKRVLRKDGVLFWNVGDCYHNGDKGGYAKDRVNAEDSMQRSNLGANFTGAPNRNPQSGLKPKDLCLIPERVALAAQADGWWVRSRILWCKPNPMPESVTDRPTDAAEHIWMFTKSERRTFRSRCGDLLDAQGQAAVHGDRPLQPRGRQSRGDCGNARSASSHREARRRFDP